MCDFCSDCFCSFVFIVFVVFFFFKQKTAYEMLISDWSADVCSSDLAPVVALFSLLQHGEVGLELLLVLPAGAVDALELRVARVAAPVGAGDLHKLERMPELAGRREVRADAEGDWKRAV